MPHNILAKWSLKDLQGIIYFLFFVIINLNNNIVYHNYVRDKIIPNKSS